MEHAPPIIDLTQFHIPMVVPFQWITMLILILICKVTTEKMAIIPLWKQNIIESIYIPLKEFFIGIIGEKHGPQYAPFCVVLFLYILVMNLLGLIPGLKSPTEVFSNNLALGIMVFFYIQIAAITHFGIKGYISHLAGSPHDMVGYLLSPLMFFLHVVGELVRPFSLSLRLFGNIYGEELAIGLFFSLVPFLIPVPFMLLTCLVSVIQAVVFSTLTAVYFSLALAEEH
ncbi:F0F1 ATP synthase subunit A [Candidatus Riflebacteria bacterium]